jgi:hypothetical protein
MHDPSECLFCGGPVGPRAVYDEANGEIACEACGAAEKAAQQLEAMSRRGWPLQREGNAAGAAVLVVVAISIILLSVWLVARETLAP